LAPTPRSLFTIALPLNAALSIYLFTAFRLE
jgi:hypothetical protein